MSQAEAQVMRWGAGVEAGNGEEEAMELSA